MGGGGIEPPHKAFNFSPYHTTLKGCITYILYLFPPLQLHSSPLRYLLAFYLLFVLGLPVTNTTNFLRVVLMHQLNKIYHAINTWYYTILTSWGISNSLRWCLNISKNKALCNYHNGPKQESRCINATPLRRCYLCFTLQRYEHFGKIKTKKYRNLEYFEQNNVTRWKSATPKVCKTNTQPPCLWDKWGA